MKGWLKKPYRSAKGDPLRTPWVLPYCWWCEGSKMSEPKSVRLFGLIAI
jgi:hypothetical protein